MSDEFFTCDQMLGDIISRDILSVILCRAIFFPRYDDVLPNTTTQKIRTLRSLRNSKATTHASTNTEVPCINTTTDSNGATTKRRRKERPKCSEVEKFKLAIYCDFDKIHYLNIIVHLTRTLTKCRIGFGEMYIFLESTRRDKFNGIHHCRPN